MRTILLDKSAFQALSAEELRATWPEDQVLATDILLLELLADERYDDGRARGLAAKLRATNSVVNVPYHMICGSELLGHEVPMGGKPLLEGHPVRDATGNAGVLIVPSEGDRSLERWAAGEFTAEDLALARTWVDSIRNFDLAFFERGFRSTLSPDQIPSSLEAIRYTLDAGLMEPERQEALLDCLLAFLMLPEHVEQGIRTHWLERDRPLLATAAPYSFYCLRCLFLFFNAVGSRVVGTRNSNFVDALYLLYLPFCEEFGSGDKLHHTLFPHVPSAGKTLKTPAELKAELAQGPY